MAEKRRLLDVWIVEGNAVYKDVPFTVVADWVQEGRLLEDDMVRSPGTEKWFRIGSTSAFAPYLPKAEAFRAEDRAEALEPVEFGISWKHGRGEEDDDVDMIPLIDISLVLLIFFMMTAPPAMFSGRANLPEARYGNSLLSSGAVWIGISKGDKGEPVYSVGRDQQAGAERDLKTEAAVVKKLEALFQEAPDDPLTRRPLVEIRIAADKALPYEVVRSMTATLEQFRAKGKVRTITAEVSEKK